MARELECETSLHRLWADLIQHGPGINRLVRRLCGSRVRVLTGIATGDDRDELHLSRPPGEAVRPDSA